MAEKICQDPKVNIPIYLGAIFGIAALVLLTVGGQFYSEKYSKEENYKKSTCLVIKAAYENATCRAKHYCFKAVWTVRYGEHMLTNATIQSKKTYRSLNATLKAAAKFKIKTRYSCWYDMRHPSIVQWKRPSTRTARILLIFGVVSAVMFAISVILGVYINRRDALGRYTPPSS